MTPYRPRHAASRAPRPVRRTAVVTAVTTVLLPAAAWAVPGTVMVVSDSWDTPVRTSGADGIQDIASRCVPNLTVLQPDATRAADEVIPTYDPDGSLWLRTGGWCDSHGATLKAPSVTLNAIDPATGAVTPYPLGWSMRLRANGSRYGSLTLSRLLDGSHLADPATGANPATGLFSLTLTSGTTSVTSNVFRVRGTQQAAEPEPDPAPSCPDPLTTLVLGPDAVPGGEPRYLSARRVWLRATGLCVDGVTVDGTVEISVEVRRTDRPTESRTLLYDVPVHQGSFTVPLDLSEAIPDGPDSVGTYQLDVMVRGRHAANVSSLSIVPAPTPSPAPVPSPSPSPSPAPSVTPTPSPAPGDHPADPSTPSPTAPPAETPQPTQEPTQAPAPVAPTQAPVPEPTGPGAAVPPEPAPTEPAQPQPAPDQEATPAPPDQDDAGIQPIQPHAPSPSQPPEPATPPEPEPDPAPRDGRDEDADAVDLSLDDDVLSPLLDRLTQEPEVAPEQERLVRPDVVPQSPVTDAGDLDSSNAGSLSGGRHGDTVTLTLPRSKAKEGDWVAVFTFPGSVSAGWIQVDSTNSVTVDISSLPEGTYQLAVADRNNELLGWAQLEVSSVASQPLTGGASLRTVRPDTTQRQILRPADWMLVAAGGVLALGTVSFTVMAHERPRRGRRQ